MTKLILAFIYIHQLVLKRLHFLLMINTTRNVVNVIILATSRENLLIAYVNTKVQISCMVTVQLISAFVFFN